MANKNIGHILCPFSGKLSVVRADKRRKLYYFSECGKIAPNLPQGQQWILSNAVLWDNEEKPGNVTVTEQYAGMPPIVTVNASKQVEKSLTPQSEPEPEPQQVVKPQEKPKKRGFLSEFLSGEGAFE